jgi:hypothetical protein
MGYVRFFRVHVIRPWRGESPSAIAGTGRSVKVSQTGLQQFLDETSNAKAFSHVHAMFRVHEIRF